MFADEEKKNDITRIKTNKSNQFILVEILIKPNQYSSSIFNNMEIGRFIKSFAFDIDFRHQFYV